jgi:hypothetical protein
MNTRKFLSAVWPQRGPYCIATPWMKPDGKTVMAHRGCDTLDDAIAYVLTKKQTKDLYFAPHALRVAREANPDTGKLQTFRTHENMREARVFFFDIDAGGPKDHYATKQDIFNALEKFLFSACLPSPFIVDSGYGIHVYWVIDTSIESLAWREPAGRLRWLAQQHDLHVDPMRTTDQSSVLRVPGTFNFKDHDYPRQVVILAEGVVTPAAELLAQLATLAPDAPGEAHSAKARRPELSVAWDGRRPPADEVADVCEHMRIFRDSQGNVREPQWHVGIGTVKYCDDGEVKAQEWSNGHPGYTREETQEKLDAWVLPPPGCEKIDHNSGDPAICDRCPFRDLAKNPVLIANLVYERAHQPAPASASAVLQNVTPPCPPPAPYTLDMTYGVKAKKDGWIYEYPMFPVQWIRATFNENCLSRWYVKTPREGWKMIELLNADLEPKTLASALRNKDVIILPKQLKPVHTFMQAYLKELRRYTNDLGQYDYVGWEVPPQELTETEKPVELGTPEYFVMHGRKISIADGSITPCVMTKNTQLDSMNHMGSLSQQIALMEFYNAPEYMAQQFAICASLATPFFRYSNLHGMLVCLTGDTGASKSTGVYFAASLWGHPELYCISGLRSNSTDKGRQERGAICRNLPFIVDEITRFEDDVAHEIALSASQPGSYTSLKSNRDFRQARGGYKSNLTLCTSNKSLVQMVNADSSGGQAGIMRVFEIRVSRNAVHTKVEADTAMRLLLRNYGWIGEDFLCRCLPHTEVVGGKFLEIQQRFEADINASQEERFATACAATALLGLKLGNKLGYFPFSYKLMREWLIDVQIPAMRNKAKLEREHTTPETILNEYLEEINPNICRVDKNTRNEPEVLYAPPHVEFKARYEISKAEVYVRTGPFRDYCNQHHHDYSSILDNLQTAGRITHRSVKKRMRAENRTLSSPILCFVIPIKTASPIAVPSTPDAPDDESRKIVEFKKKS